MEMHIYFFIDKPLMSIILNNQVATGRALLILFLMFSMFAAKNQIFPSKALVNAQYIRLNISEYFSESLKFMQTKRIQLPQVAITVFDSDVIMSINLRQYHNKMFYVYNENN